MARYLKVLSITSIVCFLLMYSAILILQLPLTQKSLIPFLTSTITSNTFLHTFQLSFKNLKFSKWPFPLSIDMEEVILQDVTQGVVTIKKLTFQWPLTHFLKGEFLPSVLRIQQAQWRTPSHLLLDQASFTINLTPSAYHLTVDRAEIFPQALTDFPFITPSFQPLLASWQFPFHLTGKIEGKNRQAPFDITFCLSSPQGLIPIKPYFPTPLPVQNFSLSGEFVQNKVSTHLQATIHNADISLQSQFFLPSPFTTFYAQGGKIEGNILGNVTAVPFDSLDHLWPQGLAEAARDWVTQHLSHGKADGTLHAQATFSCLPELKGVTMDLSHLSGQLFPYDVTVSYLGQLPPVYQTRATCTYNQHQLIIKDIKGIVNQMQLDKGEVFINNLQEEVGDIEISLQLTGDLKRHFDIIAAKPLYLLQKLGLPLKKAQGQAFTHLLLKFPLHTQLEMEDIQVEATSHLRQASAQLEDITEQPLEVEQANLEVFVNNQQLNVTGTAHLHHLPTSLTWKEAFKKAPFRWKRYLDVRTVKTFSSSNSSRFIEGDIPIHLMLEESIKGNRSLQFDASLDHLNIELPHQVYTKKRGVPAAIKIEATSPSSSVWTITNATLNGPQLKGTLSGTWGNPLSRLTFSEAQVGKIQGQFSLHILNQRLVLQGFLKELDIFPFLTGPSSGFTPSFPAEAFDISLKIDTLTFSPVYHLKEAAVKIQMDNQHLKTLEITDKNNIFHFNLAPSANGRQPFTLTAHNAAELLEIFSPGSDLKGGEMNIVGCYFLNSPSYLEAEIDIRNLIVLKAPILAKLLSLASLQGIMAAFSGEGLNFNHGHAFIKWQDKTLSIKEASLSGPALGLLFAGEKEEDIWNFTGEIIPFYTLNSIMSKLPIIGQMLSGNSTHAIFSTPFSVQGSRDNLFIQISPFTTFAPRGMRREE